MGRMRILGSQAGKRRIAIIGGGPGGICMAIKLRAAGYDDLVIFEQSDGVGGTWHRNRYPGLECDVNSELYTFSFYPNPDWTSSYPPQPEILDYMRRCAADNGLMPFVRLNSGVTRAAWDDKAGVWRLTLATGETESFDLVVGAVGMFGPLKWPDIAGLDSFKGTIFHSAHWPQDADLTGKTVSVIGTAASAVQFIPKIAPKVGRLLIYQRSPHWVLPKPIEHYGEAERARRRADPTIATAARKVAYEFLDKLAAWTELDDASEFEGYGLENLEAVEDPELRARLTPKTSWGCTRPLISNEYYPVFNRDNVELITHGVARLTESGVVDDQGVERASDMVICATGFDVERFLSVVPISGRGGTSLDDAWRSGAQAYLGITTAGFPNLFMLYGPNTNNGSILHMIECQADYIVRQLGRMDAENIAWIDVRPEVMDAYNQDLADEIGKVKVWAAGCHNYYSNAAGRVVTQYPHSMTRYREDTSEDDWSAYRAEPMGA